MEAGAQPAAGSEAAESDAAATILGDDRRQLEEELAQVFFGEPCDDPEPHDATRGPKGCVASTAAGTPRPRAAPRAPVGPSRTGHSPRSAATRAARASAPCQPPQPGAARRAAS